MALASIITFMPIKNGLLAARTLPHSFRIIYFIGKDFLDFEYQFVEGDVLAYIGELK